MATTVNPAATTPATGAQPAPATGATTPATGTGAAAGTGTNAAGTADAQAFAQSQLALITPPSTSMNVSSMANAIDAMSKVVSDRQTYLGKVSAAITAEAMRVGTPNQEAIVALNLQMSTVQTINSLNKQMATNLQNAIQTWARPQ